MVMKTDVIRARIDPALKAQAEAILAELGLSSSQALNMFYRGIVREHGLPLSLKLPNATTQKALRQASQGIGLQEIRLDDLRKEFSDADDSPSESL